jgi:hypothetical protein
VNVFPTNGTSTTTVLYVRSIAVMSPTILYILSSAGDWVIEKDREKIKAKINVMKNPDFFISYLLSLHYTFMIENECF